MPRLYAALDEALLAAVGSGDDWSGSPLLWAEPTCLAGTSAGERPVYVGTDASGLYRRTGESTAFERVAAAHWRAGAENPVAGESASAVAVSPHDPEVVWSGSERGRLYRSTDAGASFETVAELSGTLTDHVDDAGAPPEAGAVAPAGVGPSAEAIRAIAVDPGDPDRVLVVGGAGLPLVSDDRGGSWRPSPPGGGRAVTELATHPDAPGRVYAATDDGVVASRDGGETWRRYGRGLGGSYVRSVAVDPGDPDAVLATAAASVRRALDHRTAEAYLYRHGTAGVDGAKGAWTPLDDRGVPTGRGAVAPVLAGGIQPGALYAATDGGVYRTTDGGRRWVALDVERPALPGSRSPIDVVVV